MPGALHRAWRAVCSLIGGAIEPATRPERRHASRRDAAPGMRAEGSMRRLYEWTLDQLLDTRRNSELARQEELRRERRAKRRAFTLLLKLLSAEQRHEFLTYRHFHVIGGSSGNRYRIRVAAFANIDMLCADGKVRYRLCAQPAGDVPVYDMMAAQMLHLQDAVTERRFLQRANVHPALSEDYLRYYSPKDV